ncbi:hypothetical protein SYNPCC7002_A2220 [Picosynechococcus sp. PCC 7002]|nr:hypothetical protein SYNPCC7002_A2220 [Picosynechococcus sp. PCC 7002]
MPKIVSLIGYRLVKVSGELFYRVARLGRLSIKFSEANPRYRKQTEKDIKILA